MQMEKIKILALDPSVNSTGWATLEIEQTSDGKAWDEENAEWNWGLIEVEGFNYPGRLHDIAGTLCMKVGSFDIFVGEWPQFFNGQAGHNAAQLGYTINLAGIIGFVAGFFKIEPKNIHLLTAVQWKGSVAKAITRRRFFKAFNIEASYQIDHNIVDAIMILHHFALQEKYISQ